MASLDDLKSRYEQAHAEHEAAATAYAATAKAESRALLDYLDAGGDPPAFAPNREWLEAYLRGDYAAADRALKARYPTHRSEDPRHA